MSSKTPKIDSWRAKYSEKLMDGTQSKKSYIRVGYAAGNKIEYGLQPNLGRNFLGKLLLPMMLRVAYAGPNPATQPVPNPDAEFHNEGPGSDNVLPFPNLKPGSKSEAAKELTEVIGGIPFASVDERRASVSMLLPLPFGPQHGAEFKTFLQKHDGARLLLRLIDGTPPQPFDQDHVARALKDFLLAAADDGDLFMEKVDPLPVLAEDGEMLSNYVNELTTYIASKKAAGSKTVH